MDFKDPDFLAVAYWGSNIVGLIFLLVAYTRPRAARMMFAMLFGYASWVNYHLSHADPGAYLNYAERSVNIYAAFINGWFSAHITPFVTFIALGQFLIALGMLLKKGFVTLACAGVIVFLVGIAPIGYYAAFPFSITVSIAAFLIIKNDDKKFIWTPTFHHSVKYLKKRRLKKSRQFQ